MSIQIQLRRGNTEDNSYFKGAPGEITMDTEQKNFRIHDGIQTGGYKIDNANDVVHKTGNETIGGIKTFSDNIHVTKDTSQIILQNTSDEINVTPSEESGIYTQIVTSDKNGDWTGAFQHIHAHSGTHGTYLSIRKKDLSTSDYMGIGYDNSDNVFTRAPTPKASSNNRNIVTTEWINNNRTNCITEISKDINLEIFDDNGTPTLRLKAGSKVYVPNGSGVFDTITIVSDLTYATTYAGTYFVVYVPSIGAIGRAVIAQSTSGGTQPVSPTGLQLWYDTTNNELYRYNNSAWESASFPLCIFTVSGGVITSIDQVFNGFGYIGSTVFALPGVTQLVPSYRHSDGTLNNDIRTSTTVQTRTFSGTTTTDATLTLRLNGGGNIFGVNPAATKIHYDAERNVVVANGIDIGYTIIGTISLSSGKITSLTTKTPFHAADYNDMELKQDKETAINYDNISNCITEIPQDIKLELFDDNGEQKLRIKAGSKFTIPNGVGVFTTYTLPSDYTWRSTEVRTWCLCWNVENNNIFANYFKNENNRSGTTVPANFYGFFYHTDTNYLYDYRDGVRNVQCSFPVAIVTSNSSGIISIDQVFNGFGYIGSTIFALPGVKTLRPDGRNTDGTLKNIVQDTISVVTTTLSSVLPRKTIFGIGYNHKITFAGGGYYNADDNYVYDTYNPGVPQDMAICGKINNSASSPYAITLFEPKQCPFHAVDYNDIEKLCYHPNLFDHKWSDYHISDMSWVKADNFSWLSGDTYKEAYNHLLNDWNGTGDNPSVDNITYGVNVYYRRAADGHKICSASQEEAVATAYTTLGVAWYYILDIDNKRFKLPRTKFAETGLRGIVGTYVAPGLPNITGTFNKDEDEWQRLPITKTTGCFTNAGSSTQNAHDTGGGWFDGKLNGIKFDASRSSLIYGNSTTVQPPATQMYLYFYVGNFTQTALENTAGLNASLFNGKADLNLANSAPTASFAQALLNAGIDVIVERQNPTSSNNYRWYRKYKSGWVEQGGLINKATGDASVTYSVPISFWVAPIFTSSSNRYDRSHDRELYCTSYNGAGFTYTNLFPGSNDSNPVYWISISIM